MSFEKPTPIKTDIRINWVVYEFATRYEAEKYGVWVNAMGIENRGVTTVAEADGRQRHFVWARD